MRWVALLSTGILFLLGALPVRADTDILIDLTKETRQEVSIAIPEFVPLQESPYSEMIKQARQVLTENLVYFELFLPVDPARYADIEKEEAAMIRPHFRNWSRRGAQWLVKTQYQTEGLGGRVKFLFRLYDVVNHRYLMGKRYQGDPRFVRKMMQRFADELLDQLTGVRGVAETRLAFLTQTEYGKEMYAVDFDGHNLNQVTDEKSVVLSPDWSPDGRTIVFTSFRDRNPDLVLVAATGKRRKTLLKLPGLNSAPAWSPDGSQISLALSKDQNTEIYILNRWNELRRLTRNLSIDTSPTWSPDGKQIAFTSDRIGTGRPQIYIMDAKSGDARGVQRISIDSSYNDNPAWSPDGEKIAYTSRVGQVFQIRIYFLKTGKTINFTSGPGSKEEPSWSPDGRFLAYRVTQKGGSSIYIKGMNGKPARRLTRLPRGGFSPAWSPYPRRYIK